VQCALSPLPDGKGDVLAGSSPQAWLENFHLRWVPHALSINQKSERVSSSKLLPTALMAQKASGFQRLITGDKLWFFLSIIFMMSILNALSVKMPRKRAWFRSFGWLTESTVFLMCPKGQCTTRSSPLNAVMPSLIANIWSQTRRKTVKGLLIYMDNARPHNSGPVQRCIEASRAGCLLHPAYSPGLALNDFFFGYIKGKLSDCNCESWADLLNAITEYFTEVDHEVLLKLFESWANRLRWVITHERNYYLRQRKNKIHFFRIARENGRIQTSGALYLVSWKAAQTQICRMYPLAVNHGCT
jgi:hypothetical protein